MTRLLAFLVLALPLAAADLRQLNIDSFDQVWNTIRDRHWDPKLGGLDWQKVREELRPRIEQAATAEEARAILREMLGGLGHSHLGIIPAEAYGHMDPKGASREGSTGVNVRVIGGAALVVSVEPGSPAAEAGVRPGWEIRAIDGQDLAPALAAIPEGTRGKRWEGVWLTSLVMNRLAGSPGTAAEVTFRAGNRPVAAVIVRTRRRGTVYRFGFLPPVYVWSETRRLGNVGYFAFNLFLDPQNVMTAAEKAITGCFECDGFIIDLRGNGGGVLGMTIGLAGWFVNESGRLGTLFTRDAKVHFLVSPRPEVYNGSLAILVDGMTGSSAEVFAGGMQDLKRARVFGSVTAGGALPAQIEKLPNGDALLYAFADYISEGGKRLEGAGVRPDVEIGLTREALLAGRDPVLEAALKWIESRKEGKP
ncbi:MAG TPA: S41 family peptidase [Bryobacteraceae bacterium]|nr:S41 family peptidase [Bryobacteraceae bacterium]